MEINKEKLRAIKAQIRKVLLEEWDPIGIVSMEGTVDEYDAYIGPIFNRLHVGTNKLEIATLLHEFETKRMGFDQAKIEDLISVAESLMQIKIDVSK